RGGDLAGPFLVCPRPRAAATLAGRSGGAPRAPAAHADGRRPAGRSGGVTTRLGGRSVANRYLFQSEVGTEGHPDKMADQISDAVLDAILAEDPTGRVACETLITTG